MYSTQELQQTIHNYSLQVLQAGDFVKNQQIIEQLKTFILDWNNLPLFRSIVEHDQKPETIFVLYSLLQKSVAQGSKFINVLQPTQKKQSTFEELENNEKQYHTIIVITHIEIVINYFARFLNHPNHVQNQVLFTLAFLIRKYWTDTTNSDQLVEKLINTFFNSQNFSILTIGCKLFENILICVRSYYYASSYLEFRKIMMSFLKQSLSNLLTATHKLIIIQLQNKTFLQLYQEDKAFIDTLIQLINSFMTFNFNLSFYEIEADQDQKDNFLINFPDSYISIITELKLNQEIFRSIIDFYTLDQTISIKLITIVQRIAAARLSLFFGKRSQKQQVRRTLWEGLLYILNNHQIYIQNYDFCNEICIFAIKLVSNFTLKKLNKFQDLFDQCVIQFNQMNQVILSNYQIRIQPNSVFIKLQEVWNQFQIQINSYKQQYPTQYLNLSNSINLSFKLLIQAFYNGNPFANIPTSIPIKKIKKFIDKSFRLCAQVYQQNAVECTNLLLESFKKIPIQQINQMAEQEQLITIQKFSSLLCLISAFVISPTQGELLTGYDYYGQQNKQERPPQFGQLIIYILEIISFSNKLSLPVMATQQDIEKKQILKMYHTCSLIFIQTYITQTVEGVYYDENLNIVISQSQLQTSIFRDLGTQQNYLAIMESCLEQCYQIFTLNDPDLVEYSFQILQFTYEKLKRQLDRRIFQASSVNNMLRQFFLQMDFTCFNEVQNIKKRKLVYQLISLVWVDDQMDDYVPALVDIYKQIKKSIAVEINKINMLKYIWDMIGLVNELSLDKIYRIFLRIVLPDISQILHPDHTQIFVTDFDSSIGLTSLICSIFKNKNTRLSNENIQLVLYQIYGQATNYFITSINHLLAQAQAFLSQGQQVQDNILKMAAKLMKVMGQISHSKQINQGFFIIYQSNVCLDLFKKQLQLITVYRPLFQNLMKYKRYLFECLEGICQEHSETLTYKCGAEIFLQLFELSENTLKDILNFKSMKGDEQINEEAIQLSQIATIFVNSIQFLIQESVIGEEQDTAMIKQKISEIYSKGKLLLQSIFKQSFMVTVAFPKILKFLQPNSDIIFAISLFDPKEFQTLLLQLIQEYKNQLWLSNLILDPINIGYQNLENYLNSFTKDNFSKQIKYVLEYVCHEQ
ncbi:unnamed protein product [Paramecium pentaurelia]|uniref:Uncharacterized protein n=1 Tax=Paramecium pentaurelia TaxID=43138 RepID=A0A8S1TPG9_9CILI|nr:unnamed protein product [Paramecium pentaurelia]